MKDFNIREAKLIIWDLDDTFWKGNFCENSVEIIQENIKFIENLVTKGIMSSVCSKNNYEEIRNFFEYSGIKKTWDYFVFSSISWDPKGVRVKEIISNMNLREENVIFVDDNISNIQEVKYYCPNIMSAHSTQIQELINDLYMVNDYDLEHKRLQQYKILEEKLVDKQESNLSNEEFLKSCSIKVAMNSDCEANVDRIFNLSKRTNQLNFTKNRVPKEVLLLDIQNQNYESSYITVKDKYGAYGICGFYTLDKINNKLVHFFFSCRVMGMGVEQYVYQKLNSPKLEINGEVASKLDFYPNWITLVDSLPVSEDVIKKHKHDDVNILLKGPCDLMSVMDFIKPNCNVDTEFPYWNEKLIYIIGHTHTAYIEQAHKCTEHEILNITQKFPFPNMDEFKTKFFDKKYNLIVLSLLTTTHSGLYKSKLNGEYVVFGFADCDITDENNWEKILAPLPDEAREINLIMLKQFRQDYVFCGNPPVETVLENLEYITNNISPECKLILILGSEKETSKVQAGYENMASRHAVLNNAVKNYIEGKENISIMNLTDFINSDDDYTVCINHFTRNVYQNIANKLTGMINEQLGKDCLNLRVPTTKEVVSV